MQLLFSTRTIAALWVAAASILAGLMFDTSLNAMLVALVGSVAAVLLAASSADEYRASAERLRTQTRKPDTSITDILEAVDEPLLVIAGSQVERANAAALRLLGQHIVGEDVRLAIRHPAAAERLMDPVDADADRPIHLIGIGTRDQRWEMRVRSVRGARRVVHLTDRTGSHAAERMRVDFVANASHELRTPLSSLLGFIETLADEAGEDREIRNRFLTIMENEATRMQRLVDDLISLSRIEAEKYREPEERLDLGALIDEVRAELASAGGERGGDLITDLAQTPAIRGDRAQLSQLLHNVVGNAMKYGRAGTPVTIRLAPASGGMLALSVTDQGEGIAPDHLPRLTERFYRVDSGRSRALGGTGLGLAIVKHIVERHRGRLDIASVTGQGTTVTIMLPQAPVS